MNKLVKHLQIIKLHRKNVRKACFKMGIYQQGLLHDLSKYSVKELEIYKYYTGNKSPHQVCREEIGYSPSWINHYHINKHHYQYWLDESETGKFIPIKMPYKYVIESFCDMLGASKAYNKNNFSPEILWNYWCDKCEGKRLMHKDSIYLIRKLIWNYKEYGEAAFFIWYKKARNVLEDFYNKGAQDY